MEMFVGLDSIITSLSERFKIPGISLAIVKNGTVVKTLGIGFHGTSGDSSVTSRTRFNIGSLTKALTATLLASIVQELQPRVTWNTPLRQIFGPEFRLCDDFRTEQATLTDLLAHKMGIELGELDFGWMCGALNRDNLISTVQHLPASAPFRSKMIYNNFMYGLAAAVAEKVTGKSWESLVRDRIFSPLGMDDAGFLHEEGPAYKDLAIPHMLANGNLRPIDRAVHTCIGGPAAAAGSVIASAEDMAKWMLFHLARGKIGDIPLIQPRFLQECYKPHFALPSGMLAWDGYASVPTFPATETRDTYGFGWYRGTYREFSMLAHSGELFGYDCLLTLYPDTQVGIYTCFNGPGGQQAFVANQILHYWLSDALLGLKPWLSTDTMLTFPEPWLPKERYFPEQTHTDLPTFIHDRPLAPYTGTYTHGFMGEVTIKEESGKLKMAYGKVGTFDLNPAEDPNGFYMIGTDLMDFMQHMDLYSPTDWMTVYFTLEGGVVQGLHCALFESSPYFVKSDRGSSTPRVFL